MTFSVFILPVAVLFLICLLSAEKKDRFYLKLLFKPLVSSLFIIAALIRPHYEPLFYQFLISGLVCCFLGDVFLIFPKKSMFTTGLVFFLVGHLLYCIGFFSITDRSHWMTWWLPVVFIAGMMIYLWLKPYLGKMRIPVLFYILAISLMLCGSIAVLGNNHLPLRGRMLILFGALLFYISDLFVARNRFIEKKFLNRLIGLPLYYSGQFLLAFSAAYIGF